MPANSITITNNSERNLRYFSEHKRVFDVENFYPLDSFENFLKTQKECNSIDCACKINCDRLHAARFTICYIKSSNLEHKIAEALNFFRQLEGRVEVQLNYQLLDKFLKVDFNFNKIAKVLVGVDARSEITESRLKLFIWLENYREKVADALELIGDTLDSSELRSLIFNNSLLVGFDFYLNGRSAVEVYPTLDEEDLRRFDVQEMLVKLLPSKALHLLQDCHGLQIGFSQSNDSKILYFHPSNLDSFIDNLGNEIGKRD